MSILEKYHHYFNIDPDYFPAVNESIITKNPEMWKKFYPHETFVKLLKNMINVLERKQKLSLWVEGAYGTGKSYAVLTMKKLLDVNEEYTEEYFTKYNMDMDLCNRLQNVRNSGRILTVHRYGSAAIRGDHNLIFAIQESIEESLASNNIKNKGNSALKDATKKWLSDKVNMKYFNDLITGEYSELFNGDDTAAILNKLDTYSGAALEKVMDRIFRVADERQIKALSLSVNSLSNWIREIIRTNNLKAIVFIWDEFSEYFYNNKYNLTGFQELCEISETEPFYFVIVTHVSSGLFNEKDQDFIKLSARFVVPHSLISLPENIAFQLMGAAMEKKEDKIILDFWEKIKDDLADRTKESRKLVKDTARITDEEMLSILPIHPYAALLLKHISSAFDSNQRSMFDFIKNEREDEIKGFQWFINNFGPEDINPLLTIDMLWEFFYDKGRDYLAYDIRSILSYIDRTGNKNLDSDEKRILKTVLLLNAISHNAGDSVELFIPNEKNINNAFEGSDIDSGAAGRIAEKLVRDKVLFKKQLGSGKIQYCSYNNDGDVDISPFLNQIENRSTTLLINEEIYSDKSKIYEAITLNSAIKLRYELKYISSSDFDITVKQLNNLDNSYNSKIIGVVCFARDDDESAVIRKKISDIVNSDNCSIIFIDSTSTPLGYDMFTQYKQDLAYSMAYQGANNELSKQYAINANDTLKKWKNRIYVGEFQVFSNERPDGERATNIEELNDILTRINKSKFPLCLESLHQHNTNMFASSYLKQGVEFGATQRATGVFSKFDNIVEGAWNLENYWIEKPSLLISKIKIHLNTLINNEFIKNGRVSIDSIYNSLKISPYGFMPCNLTAFILGFLLKEYISGNYSWSDGLTNDILNVEKLKEVIYEIISLQITPNQRHKDKYIVALTEAEKSFNKTVSEAFNIPLNLCTSIPNTRERIRLRMKDFTFPIWALKSILYKEKLKTNRFIVEDVIDYFCGIANSNNMDINKTDNDIAITIGNLSMENPEITEDLKNILNKDKCTQGMIEYLDKFDNGSLPSIASEIDDKGQYMNVLRSKFNQDSAVWLWNIETTHQIIHEVILEYRIIAESNKILPKTTSFKDMLNEWSVKCNHIRISYFAGKNHLGDIDQLLELLYEIKKTDTIQNSKKKDFLEQLKTKADSFQRFYTNQEEVFKEVCAYYLKEFSDGDIKKLYKDIPADVFTYEKVNYISLVEEKVNAFKANQKSEKLKILWREKAGTENPKEWSKLNRMPILCLIDDSDEYTKAKMAFDTINRKCVDEANIDKAMEYLKTATFFNLLDDQNALDKKFTENIIKRYAIILTNIYEVKEYLFASISEDPYEWYDFHELDKKLEQIAEAKYNEKGINQAMEIINRMDEKDAKQYLNVLIKNNINVGMEIIRDNYRGLKDD